MLTSVCGFASLLPSSFPGLAQLGLYSIAGLITAAAVTRWLLPRLSPQHPRMRNLAPLGRMAARLRLAPPGSVLAAVLMLMAVAAAAVLYAHRGALWNRDLAALSPVAASTQALDGELRSELGAPDISNLVIVEGADQETTLQRAEAVSRQLDALAAAGVIEGYDSPARYLPSLRTQSARRNSLPDAATLRQRLRAATAKTPLRPEALEDFVAAVDAARSAPPLDRAALANTSLALALDALLWQKDGRWYALLPLRANRRGAGNGDIDIERVRSGAGRPAAGQRDCAQYEARNRLTLRRLSARGRTAVAVGSRRHPAAARAGAAQSDARGARDGTAGPERARSGRRAHHRRRTADDPAPDRPAADRRRRIELRAVLRPPRARRLPRRCR